MEKAGDGRVAVRGPVDLGVGQRNPLDGSQNSPAAP
jgi:hypothetical protein